jgi:hypothetical protein
MGAMAPLLEERVLAFVNCNASRQVANRRETSPHSPTAPAPSAVSHARPLTVT